MSMNRSVLHKKVDLELTTLVSELIEALQQKVFFFLFFSLKNKWIQKKKKLKFSDYD